MSSHIAGTWKLLAWRRITGDATTYPLGENATGILIYTHEGRMAVQITAADRPQIDSHDALGGDEQQRAAAYSTCLSYFGTYAVKDGAVILRIEASLYPNWSGTVQQRPYTREGTTLILRTPPDGSNVVNEISWQREESTRL